MAKCAHCGFPHAIQGYCSNCGSNDPLPGRKLMWVTLAVLGLLIFAALASIPVSLYFQRSAALRDYPAAPPIPSPAPIQ